MMSVRGMSVEDMLDCSGGKEVCGRSRIGGIPDSSRIGGVDRTISLLGCLLPPETLLFCWWGFKVGRWSLFSFPLP